MLDADEAEDPIGDRAELVPVFHLAAEFAEHPGRTVIMGTGHASTPRAQTVSQKMLVKCQGVLYRSLRLRSHGKRQRDPWGQDQILTGLVLWSQLRYSQQQSNLKGRFPLVMATAPDPTRLAEILTDILSKPQLTNGEAAAGMEMITAEGIGPSDSWEAAVLAAARYCWQVGGLQIALPQNSYLRDVG